MPKIILILDVGSDAVMAGLFTAPKMEPAGFLTQPIRVGPDGTVTRSEAAEALRSILSSIKEMGIKEFDRSLLGIPPGDLSIRVVTVPFEDREKLGEVLPFELAGLLHVEIEQTVIESVPLGENKVLALALEKRILREHLDELASAGVDPFWTGPALLSMPFLLKELYPGSGVKAFLGKDSFIVSDEGRLKFFKPIKRLDGIKLGLSYLEAEGLKVDEVYCAGWDKDEIIPLVPEARGVEDLTLPGGYPVEGAGIYAIALQLKKGMDAFLKETVNFRKGEFGYTKEIEARRRSVLLTGAIAAVILLLLFADVFLRYMAASSEARSYDEALKSSYLRLFPAERNVPDEVLSLEAKVNTLKKESKLFGKNFLMLEALSELATAGADVNAAITEASMSYDRLIVRGEAPSFDEANRLRDKIAATDLFTGAEMTDLKSRPAGGVSFSMTIEIKK